MLLYSRSYVAKSYSNFIFSPQNTTSAQKEYCFSPSSIGDYLKREETITDPTSRRRALRNPSASSSFFFLLIYARNQQTWSLRILNFISYNTCSPRPANIRVFNYLYTLAARRDETRRRMWVAGFLIVKYSDAMPAVFWIFRDSRHKDFATRSENEQLQLAHAIKDGKTAGEGESRPISFSWRGRVAHGAEA